MDSIHLNDTNNAAVAKGDDFSWAEEEELCLKGLRKSSPKNLVSTMSSKRKAGEELRLGMLGIWSSGP